MFFRSIQPIITDAGAEALAGLAIAVPGAALANPGSVGLLADMTGLTPQSLQTDFNLLSCTFTGYGTAGVVPVGPFRLASGLWVAQFPGAIFQATSPFTSGPQNALGYWIDQNGADPVLMYEAFPQPIPFAQAFDFLQLDATLPIWANLRLP